ncbi:hypothetical protein HMPREF0063_12945 [Aeromicrobium marinum DSM 15272]|uniref:ER-bound oxygenase mpaB/mpaB'/Rubber oxygenase catalytic domain-containing protein n=1 Tax=Aeromicrobium marinum DSM 15272 TaxID=585531 RepID=E2SFY6_9ACTN|nr:oxygenase MpaB family protein [Aeromicrobium marinum]EFQ81933.1 hypothetical protein HMPREF0063_12945 [Aeromicrobium marinum DSM 15272]
MSVTTPSEAPVVLPTRFRAAEARGARMGRLLRPLGRVRQVDEDLMTRLGRGLMEVDETGAALARAMRRPAGDPARVSMAQLKQATDHGIDTVEDAPAALVEFFTRVEATPAWVDLDLVDEGARVFRRLGQNAADVLLQLSLIGGYRFGGPTDLLVATGGLVGDTTMRRLGETQKWAVAVGQPGAMRRGGEGWALTVHVRAMHALVNEGFAHRWDAARWGRPINQTDQAATLGLFSGVVLVGCRSLGARITRDESLAVMHLWKYVGWLMGVDGQWLVDTEREQHHLNYHVLLAQDDLTEAGPALTQAIVEAQGSLHITAFTRLRRHYARERLLSMLTVFLGPRSMRELGLPLRPPWAFALAHLLNVVRYRIVGRSAWGEQALQAWGARVRARTMSRYFGTSTPEIGRLTV